LKNAVLYVIIVLQSCISFVRSWCNLSLKNRKGLYVLISPVYIANNFLRKGKEENIDITPLKLQKLVYFLYKRYLQKTKELLFSERFETWKYGPVVPSIYSEFSSYGNTPIQTFAKDSQDNIYFATERGEFGECMKYVWANYKSFTGEKLSEFTHEPNTAWSKAKEKQSVFLDIEDIMNEK